MWRTKSTGVTQQVIDELKTKDKFILYLTVEGLMHTNKTIKSGFYYIGKELDASIVPTKIDYKNRRFELMEEYILTESLENDKNALMNVYHMVEGRNKNFTNQRANKLLVIFLIIVASIFLIGNFFPKPF
ncbi:MAG: hypothetical protein Ct9H90mP10_07080 [Actinomycetota bacterium]|nr:MAG: hypothetical protein Ct9H90mP10_07080 [Actinomycetota bacterium]